MLVPTKRLCLRHPGDRLNERLRRLKRGLYRTWTARTWLAATASLPCARQILRPHLNGAGNALRPSNDTRLYVECSNRLTSGSGDDAWRNTGIYRNASSSVVMLNPHRPVDDDGLPKHENGTLRRQNVRIYSRRHHVTRLHEDPIRWIVIVRVDDIVGRQRRPADVIVATAPVDPGWPPIVAGYPEPAQLPVV